MTMCESCITKGIEFCQMSNCEKMNTILTGPELCDVTMSGNYDGKKIFKKYVFTILLVIFGYTASFNLLVELFTKSRF